MQHSLFFWGGKNPILGFLLGRKLSPFHIFVTTALGALACQRRERKPFFFVALAERREKEEEEEEGDLPEGHNP